MKGTIWYRGTVAVPDGPRVPRGVPSVPRPLGVVPTVPPTLKPGRGPSSRTSELERGAGRLEVCGVPRHRDPRKTGAGAKTREGGRVNGKIGGLGRGRVLRRPGRVRRARSRPGGLALCDEENTLREAGLMRPKLLEAVEKAKRREG